MFSTVRIFSVILGVVLVSGSLGFDVAQTLADAGAKTPISVITPWARATPGGVRVGAAYLEVRTLSKTGDRLIAVASPRAGRAELHSHVMENGVMKMRKVDGFAVGSESSLVFAPGGNHIMLLDLKGPLKPKEKLPLTLTFEKAGAVTVTANVAPIGAQGLDGKDTRGSASDDKAARGSGSEHDGAH